MMLHAQPTRKKQTEKSWTHPITKLMQNNPVGLELGWCFMSAQQHTVIAATIVPENVIIASLAVSKFVWLKINKIVLEENFKSTE